jgi:hypothetical protein
MEHGQRSTIAGSGHCILTEIYARSNTNHYIYINGRRQDKGKKCESPLYVPPSGHRLISHRGAEEKIKQMIKELVHMAQENCRRQDEKMENSRAPFIFLSGQGLTYLNRHFTWNS